MTQPFSIDVSARAGINVLVPEEEAIHTVNDIIFKELCVGVVRDSSKDTLLAVIRQLQDRGRGGRHPRLYGAGIVGWKRGCGAAGV